MSRFVRGDGQITHQAKLRFGRRTFVAEWVPPKLYTRAELSYMRSVKGDGAVTLTLWRLVLGWYW